MAAEPRRGRPRRGAPCDADALQQARSGLPHVRPTEGNLAREVRCSGYIARLYSASDSRLGRDGIPRRGRSPRVAALAADFMDVITEPGGMDDFSALSSESAHTAGMIYDEMTLSGCRRAPRLAQAHLAPAGSTPLLTAEGYPALEGRSASTRARKDFRFA
jgi:hypothetical protein